MRDIVRTGGVQWRSNLSDSTNTAIVNALSIDDVQRIMALDGNLPYNTANIVGISGSPRLNGFNVPGTFEWTGPLSGLSKEFLDANSGLFRHRQFAEFIYVNTDGNRRDEAIAKTIIQSDSTNQS